MNPQERLRKHCESIQKIWDACEKEAFKNACRNIYYKLSMNHYRTLKQGETILPGDEYQIEEERWLVRGATLLPEKLNLYNEGGHHAIHRRKVEYPEHTPPAPPEGMRWEYREMGWRLGKATIYYTYNEDRKNVSKGGVFPAGCPDLHYFEAVPVEKMDEIADTTSQVLAENPKEVCGRAKCPMHLLSPSAMRETANALGHGAAKYSARNYRTAGVNATTYVGAILRHISAWNDGEDLDPESGLSHIAHVAACADILLDTMACGMMNDDRSKKP